MADKNEISREELARYAVHLLKMIRNDNSIDINQFRKAQQFFIEYVKNTDSLNEFVDRNGYLVIDTPLNSN